MKPVDKVMGSNGRRWPERRLTRTEIEERAAYIARRRSEGASLRVIADETECSKGTVLKIIREQRQHGDDNARRYETLYVKNEQAIRDILAAANEYHRAEVEHRDSAPALGRVVRTLRCQLSLYEDMLRDMVFERAERAEGTFDEVSIVQRIPQMVNSPLLKKLIADERKRCGLPALNDLAEKDINMMMMVGFDT